MTKRLPATITVKLVALLAAATIGSAAISSAAILTLAQSALKDQLGNQFEYLLADKSLELSRLSSMRFEQLRALSQNNDFTNFVYLLSQKEAGYEVDDARLKTLSDHILTAELPGYTAAGRGELGFFDLMLTDHNGKVIFGTNASMTGTIVSDNIAFKNGKYGNFLASSFSEEKKIPISTYAIPVQIRFGILQSPEILPPIIGLNGTLIGIRDNAVANQILGNITLLGKTGEMYIVNDEYMQTTKSKFIQSDRPITVDTIPVRECFERGLDMRGLNRYLDYRGVEVYGSSACFQELHMVVIAEVDAEDLMRPITSFQDKAFVFLVVLLIAEGAVVAIASPMFTKPILRIKKVVDQVSLGNYSARIDKAGSDELGMLAASINKMSAIIQKKTDELVRINADLLSATEEMAAKNRNLHILTEEVNRKTVELAAASRSKEEFTAMITHELKTPLIPIIGYLDLLLKERFGPVSEKQRQKMVTMRQSATQLLALIQDLLDAHRLELGVFKFEFHPSSVRQMMAESVESMLPMASLKGVSIKNVCCGGDSGADEIIATCDSRRIVQVLNNLLSNSIKFSKEAGRLVELAARKTPDGAVEFMVRDNGIGIEKEKLPLLFRKFYQADTSTTRRAGGSGLGLAIARGIVEGHHGRIWAESEGLGKGSTFWFTIPELPEK